MDITLGEFLEYLSTYNQRIFPMQYIAYILGVIIIILIFKPSKFSNQIISGILAFLCLWVALLFGLPFALEGELVGILTTVLFLLQGVLFIFNIVSPKFNYGLYSAPFTIIGLGFILYAMVGYPIFGYFLGHTYPQSMPFGLVPCPLTIFIFGTFMLTTTKIPKWLLILPILYSITAFFPIAMGILEDIGLLLSSLVCAPLIFWRDRRLSENSVSST